MARIVCRDFKVVIDANGLVDTNGAHFANARVNVARRKEVLFALVVYCDPPVIFQEKRTNGLCEWTKTRAGGTIQCQLLDDRLAHLGWR